MSDNIPLIALVWGLLVTPACAETLTDPTRPATFRESGAAAVETQDQASPPQLQAVFSSAGKYSAMLDGRRVQAGDRLGEYAVLEIARDRVTLDREGKLTVLRLAGLTAVRGTQEEDR